MITYDWIDGKPVKTSTIYDWIDGKPYIIYRAVRAAPEVGAVAILSVKSALRLETTKEINGLWHAFIEIEKDDYILPEGYLEFNKELYIVKTIEDSIFKGFLTQKIWADHLMTELNDYTIAPFDTTTTGTATITAILAGTGWKTRSVNVSGSKRVYTDKRISVLAALNLAADAWDGELDFYSISRSVDFKTQIGRVTKTQVRYDKNAEYITRRRDTAKLITRLYGYGADDITIGSVNDNDGTKGQEYLESAAINDYRNVKEYTIYTNIPDKSDLMTYMQAYIDLYDSEFYYYTSGLANLSVVSSYASEKIRLGDTLRVYNKDMDINVDVRVKKIIQDLANPLNLYIELDNKTERLEKDLQDMLYRLEAVTPYVNDLRTLDLRNVIVPQGSSSGIPVTWVMYVGGVLSAGAYQGPIVHVDRACTAYEIWAYCAWKPTGGNVRIRMNRTGTNIGEVVIPASAYVAPGTGEVGAGAVTPISVSLNYGDLLNIDILEADGIAERVTVALRCK